MTHQIVVTPNLDFIIGRICYDERGDCLPSYLEKPLILTLGENDTIHFMTYDIFNADDKVKFENFISMYKPSQTIIQKYEDILNEFENLAQENNNQPSLKLFDFDNNGGSDDED